MVTETVTLRVRCHTPEDADSLDDCLTDCEGVLSCIDANPAAVLVYVPADEVEYYRQVIEDDSRVEAVV